MKKFYIFIITLFIILSIFKFNVQANDYEEIEKLFGKDYKIESTIAEDWAVVSWRYKNECEGMALIKYTDDKWTVIMSAGGFFDYDLLSEKNVPVELWQKLLPTDGTRWTFLTSEKNLTEDDLNYRYTALILTLMRNEIFAKYGKKFEDPFLCTYFESCPWYKVNPDYNDNMLTEIESYNAKFILDYQEYNSLIL